MPIETLNEGARCELRLFHPAEKCIFFPVNITITSPPDSENPAPVHAKEYGCKHKKNRHYAARRKSTPSAQNFHLYLQPLKKIGV